VDAAYLFGSRLDDGIRLLDGGQVSGDGPDLDVGVFFAGPLHVERLADLQVALEDVLTPLRVDLVPLDRVDALIQFRAIDGRRVFEADSTRADRRELTVMRRAAELLPIQRRIERERFGVATS
jgi:predicted nucleotidyltransferase